MKGQFTILVTDRNRHVRDFLKRELVADGHSVRVAEDSAELVNRIERDETLDLLILDLDMPVLKGLEVLMRLKERVPLLPVILCCFSASGVDPNLRFLADAVLEKSGDIDSLRKATLRVLRHYYPNRVLRTVS